MIRNFVGNALRAELFGGKILTKSRSRRSKKMGPEWYECRAFWQWICLYPEIKKYTIKIANEGKRTPVEGHLLHLIGWSAGIPDYFIAIPNEQYHGIFIEIKFQIKSYTSHAQHSWINRLSGIGYHAIIAYGWQEAADCVTKYLLNTNRHINQTSLVMN